MTNFELLKPTKIQQDIFKKYSKKYSYKILDKNKLSSKCESNSKNFKFELSKTQDFLKTFSNENDSENGMLLYHSVGSGKTLSGIAMLKEFENKKYNTLWITRTTLKDDLNKGLNLLKLSKKLTVLSYKQFSNIGKNKGAIFKKLVKNDPNNKDPLYKTVVVIDEAHKLYTKDLKSQEMHDIKSIEKMIQNSYAFSKIPCKIILMSATPITKNPMEMIKLFNLIIKNQDDRFDEKNFLDLYVDKSGKFKKDKIELFRKKIDGLISYLDVSKNPEKFAQLNVKEIKTKISFPETDSYRKKNICKDSYDVCRKQLGIDTTTCRNENERCKKEVKILKDKNKNKHYQSDVLKTKCEFMTTQ